MNLKAKRSKHLMQFVSVCLTRHEVERVLMFALSFFLREPCALTSTFSSGAMLLTLRSTEPYLEHTVVYMLRDINLETIKKVPVSSSTDSRRI
jgi:hypothetical protein